MCVNCAFQTVHTCTCGVYLKYSHIFTVGHQKVELVSTYMYMYVHVCIHVQCTCINYVIHVCNVVCEATNCTEYIHVRYTCTCSMCQCDSASIVG